MLGRYVVSIVIGSIVTVSLLFVMQLLIVTGKQALTDPACAGAVQIPFISGTEPNSSTECLEKMDSKNRKSLWRKWFEGKN